MAYRTDFVTAEELVEYLRTHTPPHGNSHHHVRVMEDGFGVSAHEPEPDEPPGYPTMR